MNTHTASAQPSLGLPATLHHQTPAAQPIFGGSSSANTLVEETMTTYVPDLQPRKFASSFYVFSMAKRELGGHGSSAGEVFSFRSDHSLLFFDALDRDFSPGFSIWITYLHIFRINDVHARHA